MAVSRTVPIVQTIGDASRSDRLRDEVIAGLSLPAGEKFMSPLVLYDERGLRIYDEITDVPDYYLFGAEKVILETHADEIARIMHSGFSHVGNEAEPRNSLVVELGAGALTKTSLILGALARQVPGPSAEPPVQYYALDLEKRELERTLVALNQSAVGTELLGKVSTNGLCGTYDDGLKYITSGGLDGPSAAKVRPALHIIFLGSSLGNFARGDDAAFLRSLPLRPGSGDTLLIGLDHGYDPERMALAYNSPTGTNRRFVLNGLKCAGRALGDESLFEERKWEYVSKHNEELRRHEACYQSTCDQTIVTSTHTFAFIKGELVNLVYSHKYSEQDTSTLFADAGLTPVRRWTDIALQYSLWLLERPAVV
ncbi:histidine-specific methyltransferase [Trametes elegans]|nr:histidine-specific methyltransferase [Trametes elegans]